MMSYVTVDTEKCTRDLLCIMDCPQKILAVKLEDGLPYMIDIGPKFCMQCGHCVAICPSGALSLNNMPAAECEKVQRDMLPGLNGVNHLLKSRRSIRHFKESKVDREDIINAIGIASYAPKAHNCQDVQWIVYEGKDKVHHLAGMVAEWMKNTINEEPKLAATMHLDLVLAAWQQGKDNIMRDAPNLVIACSSAGSYNGPSSCTIALTYLEIAAYASGVGACWAGFFTAAAQSYQPLIEELGLNEMQVQVHGAMLLGYPRYRYFRIPQRKEPAILYK